jgi:hypothetical protein
MIKYSEDREIYDRKIQMINIETLLYISAINYW